MFRYSDTKKLSKSGESQRKVVTKVRQVRYLNDSPNPSVAAPVETFGTEIVEEKAVSPEYMAAPEVERGTKTVDNRNPNRVVQLETTKKSKEESTF